MLSTAVDHASVHMKTACNKWHPAWYGLWYTNCDHAAGAPTLICVCCVCVCVIGHANADIYYIKILPRTVKYC